jgi:hypothetical protein
VYISVIIIIFLLDLLAFLKIMGFKPNTVVIPYILTRRVTWIILSFPILYIFTKLFPKPEISEKTQLSDRQKKTGLSIAFGSLIVLCIMLFILIYIYNKKLA